MSTTSSYLSNSIESLRASLIALQKDMSSLRNQYCNHAICNLAGFSAVGRKFQNRSSPSSYSTSSHDQNVSSVPLQGYHVEATSHHRPLHHGDRPLHHGDRHHRQRQQHRVHPDRKPRVSHDHSVQSAINLSQLLTNGEEVTFRVIVGKDEAGNAVYTHTVATFDGTNFNVTSSELVPSLVGLTSSKPGEILYKLIDGLTQGGHLTRKFSIAPWRLCFVKRDGNYVSLNQLRLDSLNRV